jgi:histone deacetylase complex regulatory component SIN3
LKIFSDFSSGGTSVEVVSIRVKELFKDEPDLVEGFEKFMPANNPKKVELEATKEEAGSVL